MKLFTRVAVLLVFVLTLLVPAAATAQEQCFGLSEADCALFYGAGAADFTSFAFSYDFELTISGTTSVTSTGEGTFTMVPEATDPLKAFNLAVVVEGSATDEMGDTESGTVEIRIIDGVLYLSDGNEWTYTDVEALLSELEELGISADTMMSAGEAGAMEGMMSDMDATIANHVTMTRGEDSTVDGETAASFTVALDLNGLLADPGLTEMFANLPPEVLAGALGSGGEMTEEEIQQMTAMMPMLVGMLGMMFQNTEAYLSVDAGVDSGKLYGFELHFATDLDASALGGSTGEAMSILFHLGVDISDYDGAFEYVVPEGATEMDMSGMDLMGSMGGF
jgi:hypothetical protein